MADSIVDATNLAGTSTDIVVVQGQVFEFHNTITKDGAVYNLTGLTVEATIFRQSAPTTVVDASLVDMTVTVANTETTAANGGVTLALTAAQTALLTYTGESTNPWHREPWLLQYYVRTDTLPPDMLRFQVRPVID